MMVQDPWREREKEQQREFWNFIQKLFTHIVLHMFSTYVVKCCIIQEVSNTMDIADTRLIFVDIC